MLKKKLSGAKPFETDLELETAFDMLKKEFVKSTHFTEKVALDAADALTKNINGAGYITRKIFIKGKKPFYSYVKILGYPCEQVHLFNIVLAW